MHREIIPSNKYESLFTFLKIKVPKGENVHSDATEEPFLVLQRTFIKNLLWNENVPRVLQVLRGIINEQYPVNLSF